MLSLFFSLQAWYTTSHSDSTFTPFPTYTFFQSTNFYWIAPCVLFSKLERIFFRATLLCLCLAVSIHKATFPRFTFLYSLCLRSNEQLTCWNLHISYSILNTCVYIPYPPPHNINETLQQEVVIYLQILIIKTCKSFFKRARNAVITYIILLFCINFPNFNTSSIF